MCQGLNIANDADAYVTAIVKKKKRLWDELKEACMVIASLTHWGSDWGSYPLFKLTSAVSQKIGKFSSILYYGYLSSQIYQKLANWQGNNKEATRRSFTYVQQQLKPAQLFISNEMVFVRSLKPIKVFLKWDKSEECLLYIVLSNILNMDFGCLLYVVRIYPIVW